jgi:hypothetical protein
MGAMETTGPIPVTLDTKETAARLRFDPTKAGFESLDGLIAFAEGLIKPRGVMTIGFVGTKGERTVEVAGVTFDSPVLRQNLEKANKVFPTSSRSAELERAAVSQATSSGNIISRRWRISPWRKPPLGWPRDSKSATASARSPT